jgi:hypothetical protein
VRRVIRYHGYHYRVAQDDPLGEVPEEGEQPVNKKPEKFDWAAFADKLQEEPTFLAQALAIGIAGALIKAGITDKKQLRGSNPQPLISALTKVLRAAASARQPFVQELRMIGRFGPKQYLQRRGRALSAMK